MSGGLETLVLAVLLLATSIWVGGYVTVGLVARTASATLTPDARVAFFRRLGRSYFWVGTPALVVALGTGSLLARDADHGMLFTVAVAIAVLLIVSFAIAVVQARRMTRLRRQLLGSQDDAQLAERVRRGAAAAGTLRAVLGLLSIALVVLGACLAT